MVHRSYHSNKHVDPLKIIENWKDILEKRATEAESEKISEGDYFVLLTNAFSGRIHGYQIWRDGGDRDEELIHYEWYKFHSRDEAELNARIFIGDIIEGKKARIKESFKMRDLMDITS